MKNELQGSEKTFVKKCQDKYLSFSVTPANKLSDCTQNAADFLIKSRFSIFGLQEVNKTYLNTLTSYIQKHTNSNYQFIIGPEYFAPNTNLIVTGYNEAITGKGISLSSNLYLNNAKGIPERPMQIIWFAKIGVIFINLHAPHNIDLHKAIQYNIDLVHESTQVEGIDSVRRVIMVGDFNDDHITLTNKSFSAFGKVMKKENVDLKSCCDDTDYAYEGDYIFDSEYSHSYYGFPKDYDSDNPPLMSDHHPVVLLD